MGGTAVRRSKGEMEVEDMGSWGWELLASTRSGLIWMWSHVGLAEAHFISVLMH